MCAIELVKLYRDIEVPQSTEKNVMWVSVNLIIFSNHNTQCPADRR